MAYETNSDKLQGKRHIWSVWRAEKSRRVRIEASYTKKRSGRRSRRRNWCGWCSSRQGVWKTGPRPSPPPSRPFLLPPSSSSVSDPSSELQGDLAGRRSGRRRGGGFGGFSLKCAAADKAGNGKRLCSVHFWNGHLSVRITRITKSTWILFFYFQCHKIRIKFLSQNLLLSKMIKILEM